VLWKKTVRNFDRQYQQDPASTQNSNPELQFRYVRGIRARKWSFQLGQSYIVGRSGQVTRRASEHETKLNFSIMLIYVAQCFLTFYVDLCCTMFSKCLDMSNACWELPGGCVDIEIEHNSLSRKHCSLATWCNLDVFFGPFEELRLGMLMLRRSHR
jgi:hypothetical protein